MRGSTQVVHDRDARPLRGRHLLWIVAAIVAGLVAVGVFATIRDEPPPLDANTPEGVVQAYLEALLAHDVTTARSHLTETAAERCSTQDFHRSWIPDNVTASLIETREAGDGVEVWVRLRTIEGPALLGGGDFAMTEVFTLAEVDGAWRISGEPWPVYDCGGRP